MFRLAILIFVLVLSGVWKEAAAEQLPAIAGQSLSGHSVPLPGSVAGHPALLIIGFSRASQKAVEHWNKQVESRLKPLHPDLEHYQIAVIQDAPRLVRGMIVHSMKGATPALEQDHLLTVTQNQDELKKAAGYSGADDAYLLLLDASGNIRWRAHGDVAEGAVKELVDQATALAKK